MKQFKSVLHGDKIAYKLTDDWNWNGRGNAPLGIQLEQYETYGDNLTQHSNSWCVQFSDLTDACLSLASAILEDPMSDEWRSGARMFTELNSETAQFLFTVKFREDKDQWFNLSERKLTSSKTKQYDRRWSKVESWMDGTPSAAFSIICQDRNYDWLERVCIAEDLRQFSGYCQESTEVLKPLAELKGDWHQAFQAARKAVQAFGLLGHTANLIKCGTSNSQTEPEPVTP